jgi:hypothetical protein
MGRFMSSLARTGTCAWFALVLLGLCSCSAEQPPDQALDAARGATADAQPATTAPNEAATVQATPNDAAVAVMPDAGSALDAGPARDAAAEAALESPRDAGSDSAPGASAECSAHADCMLVAKSCCTCEKTLDNVRAERVDAGASVPCPGLCGACPEPPPYDPLNLWVAPACLSGRCGVHDLRRADETRCTRDDECETVHESLECCQSCSSDPRFYRAKRKDRAVTRAGSPCAGDVGCPPCVPTLPPAFCAADGHCAVRAR